MVHALTQQLPTARSRTEPGRVLTLFAAVAVALIGVGLGPGNAHANQTYPAALAATLGPEAAALVAKIPFPKGTRYLARKQIERIAKGGIGKLRGLRIGPFAPGATSEALPLGRRKLQRRWGVLHWRGKRLNLAEETFVGLCEAACLSLRV